ncbi:MAG: ribbon-helix-helix protein, CopG family [Acidobacteriota bacterium]|nr:ribbon-helix-helix protein, CopG family [Acidobacteriota bacterium]
MSIALSFRTEELTRDELDQLAKTLDRNRNWVINEAIAGYLELYRWQIEEIDQGLAELDAGQSLSLTEVRARFSPRKKAKAK